jgi:hypothetical protein
MPLHNTTKQRGNNGKIEQKISLSIMCVLATLHLKQQQQGAAAAAAAAGFSQAANCVELLGCWMWRRRVLFESCRASSAAAAIL